MNSLRPDRNPLGVLALLVAGTAIACGARTSLDEYALPGSSVAEKKIPPADAGGDVHGPPIRDAARDARDAADAPESDAPTTPATDAARDVGDAADAADVRDAPTTPVTDAARDARDAADVSDPGDEPSKAAKDAASEARETRDVSDEPTPPVADAAHDASPPSRDARGAIDVDAASISPPRPIAPLSTATVTSQTPRLRWALPDAVDGAQVEICRDRACTQSFTTFLANGSSGAPTGALGAGVYFWRVRGTVGGAVGLQTSPVWELIVGARSAPVDTSWGTMVDVNGDGFADVLIGAPDARNKAASSTGQVQIFLGSAAGLAQTPVTLDLPSGNTTSFPDFGFSVASAGDVNGDGFADVIIGTPGGSGVGAGSAYLYLGSADGLSSAPVLLSGPPYYGSVVTSAGDVNGDGYADVIVAGPQGGADVYLGSAMGLSTSSATLNTLGGEIAVASAGDINGDGFGDVVTGNCYASANTDEGAAYVYMGSASGLSTTPLTISGPTGHFFAYSVGTAGDVDGDGYADLAIGAAGDVPAVYVYAGGAGGPSVVPTVLMGPAMVNTTMSVPSSEFAASLASAGDLNSDGFADLVVGAPGIGDNAGAAYVYLGGANGISTTPITLTPASSSAYFGWSVSGAGDVNGDGFADVMMGAFLANGVGAAYLYLGAQAGLPTAPSVFQGTQSRSKFGWSVQ